MIISKEREEESERRRRQAGAWLISRSLDDKYKPGLGDEAMRIAPRKSNRITLLL